MTLDFLRTLYPPCAGGVTGWIPMWYVESHLDEIKALVKEHKLCRRYRGPRRKRSYSVLWCDYAEHTLKRDAVAMVLYSTWRTAR